MACQTMLAGMIFCITGTQNSHGIGNAKYTTKFIYLHTSQKESASESANILNSIDVIKKMSIGGEISL